MKKVTSSFAVFFVLNLCYHSFGQSNIDVLHYRFDIGLSDRSDTIKGSAYITVRFTASTDKFWLNLVSTRAGKGMLAYLAKEGADSLTLMQSDDTLSIHLRKPAKSGDTRTFQIFYAGIPADGLIISRNKYGDRTFFADNWPNRAHNWIPCKDEPDDKASFEFYVTAPAQYRVISNGRLEEEKMLTGNMKLTHWNEDVSLSTKVMVIGVARFSVKQYENSPPGIPVSAWTYPQDSITGVRNYSFAPSILKFYSGFIAPYPYNKLANVQSKTIFGGMENASAIFYSEESAEQQKSVEDLLAHEIAHQWFGDMASETSFRHLWLSEGFATYMTDIYLESKYGTDSMNRRLRDERKTVINFVKRSHQPVVDSVSSLMDLLDPNSYQKGAWVLHMLRRQIGDSLFHDFIRAYYQEFKGKNASTGDLEKVAEGVAHKDLKDFFIQWLYTPGIPQLQIRWKPGEKNQGAVITVEQTQKQGAFDFPLEMTLEGQASSKTVSLHISKLIETFSIPAGFVVTNLSADPGTKLLFDSNTEKITQ